VPPFPSGPKRFNPIFFDHADGGIAGLNERHTNSYCQQPSNFETMRNGMALQ